MTFVKFPSIMGFHNVVKTVELNGSLVSGPVEYRGKIKLHGTNAGVRINTDGTVEAQARNSTLTVTDDNVGFAKWVVAKSAYWQHIASYRNDLTVFGEWCGPGIQKKTAINLIPTKIFAVFGICVGDADTGDFVTSPDVIRNCLSVNGKVNIPSDIHVLPWMGTSFIVDYGNREGLQNIADHLSNVVEQTEPCDPWVKAVFGVEGTAEGFVYYPHANNEIIPRYLVSNLSFKAKGEKHKVVKTDKVVQIDPEVASSIEQFVEMFVTEARLNQGVTEATAGVFELKQVGTFLAWFGKDVEKESQAELEASDLEWKQVGKAVQAAARNWYIDRAKAI